MSNFYELEPPRCFNPISAAATLEMMPDHPENLQLDFATRLKEVEELYTLYNLGESALSHSIEQP